MRCERAWGSKERARHRGVGTAWGVLCALQWRREGLCPSISPSEIHFCRSQRNRCVSCCGKAQPRGNEGVNASVERDGRLPAEENHSHGKLEASGNEVWGITWFLPVSLPRCLKVGAAATGRRGAERKARYPCVKRCTES